MNCTVISLNVCSIVHSNRRSLFLDFIKQHNANIYLLQETQVDNVVKIRIPGYSVYRADIKRGWGGTAIIIDSNIPVRNLRTTNGSVHSISMECKLSGSWLRISSAYFPHGKLNPDDIDKFFSDNKNTFFGVDTNGRHIAFGDGSTNIYGNALLNLANTTNLRIFNSSTPTCFKTTNGSYIDKFLSNSSLAPIGQVESIPNFSDHLAIKCVIPCCIPDTATFHAKLKNFDKTNVDKLNGFILNNLRGQIMPLNSNLTQDECEKLATNINQILESAVERYVPSTTTRGTAVLLSSTTRLLQGESKKLYKLLAQNKNLLGFHRSQFIRTRIRLLRTMILNNVRHETGNFFTNTFNSIKNDRDAFRIIKRFTGHKKLSGSPDALFTDSNKTNCVTGNANIANLLATNFSNNNKLTLNMQSDYTNVVSDSIDFLNAQKPIIKFGGNITPDIADSAELIAINGNLPQQLRGVLTSMEEVSVIINSRPNKKSSGSDCMPYYLIKQFNHQLVRAFTIFFNQLLAISHFPKCWQFAIVTPIPKPGKDATLVENWRPVSQLCCTSKIYERIVAARINNHLHTIDIFKNQFGFLSGNSTYHALAKIQSDINRGLNNNRVTTLVALDLKAAFDTIWHNGLLHKLLSLKFPITIIKIIQNALSSRRFAVRLENLCSEVSHMDAGIPQGSVLGPPLFNIYIHDVPTHEKIQLTQFADDTTIHVVHNDPARTQNMINRYLLRMFNYFKNWKLQLSESKTELIHIMGQVRDTTAYLRRNTRNMKITLGGHLLEHSNDIRLLGLRLQTNNRFTKHISIRLDKAKKAKFHLNRIFKNSKINTKTKTTMYKLYVRFILMYASPVWCRQPQVTSHQMELIRRFERGCLRSTANIRRPRGSFRHINASEIYNASSCMRVDRFAVLAHLNFYGKVTRSNHAKFNSINARFSNGKYSSMPYLFDQHLAGNLLVNNGISIFNTRYNGKPGLIYATGQ